MSTFRYTFPLLPAPHPAPHQGSKGKGQAGRWKVRFTHRERPSVQLAELRFAGIAP